MKKYEVYCDGACSPNPGVGGYASLIIESSTAEIAAKRMGGFRKSTNNRMELLSVIVALESLTEPSDVLLVCDSKYVLEPLRLKWIDNWQRNGWRKSDKKMVLNTDLWMRLLKAAKPHRLQYKWVEGHSGNQYNEVANSMATLARMQENLAVDEEYEKKVW